MAALSRADPGLAPAHGPPHHFLFGQQPVPCRALRSDCSGCQDTRAPSVPPVCPGEPAVPPPSPCAGPGAARPEEPSSPPAALPAAQQCPTGPQGSGGDCPPSPARPGTLARRRAGGPAVSLQPLSPPEVAWRGAGSKQSLTSSLSGHTCPQTRRRQSRLQTHRAGPPRPRTPPTHAALWSGETALRPLRHSETGLWHARVPGRHREAVSRQQAQAGVGGAVPGAPFMMTVPRRRWRAGRSSRRAAGASKPPWTTSARWATWTPATSRLCGSSGRPRQVSVGAALRADGRLRRAEARPHVAVPASGEPSQPLDPAPRRWALRAPQRK